MTGTTLPRGALATVHQPCNTQLVPASGRHCSSWAFLPSHLSRLPHRGTAATWQYASLHHGITINYGGLSSPMRSAVATMPEVDGSLLVIDSLFELLCMVKCVCSWLRGCEHVPPNTHLAVIWGVLVPTMPLSEPEWFQDDLQEGKGCGTQS